MYKCGRKRIPLHKDDSGTPNVFWQSLVRVDQLQLDQRHNDPCGPSGDPYVHVGRLVHDFHLWAGIGVTSSVVGVNNAFDSRTVSVYDG